MGDLRETVHGGRQAGVGRRLESIDSAKGMSWALYPVSSPLIGPSAGHPASSDRYFHQRGAGDARFSKRSRSVLYGALQQGHTRGDTLRSSWYYLQVRPRSRTIRRIITHTTHSNNLIFRSSLSTTSSTFQGLIVSTSRTSTLASLPPLPTQLVAPLNPEYPAFAVSGPAATLPFPPHPLHRHQPRPASTPLLGPLASLFGGARSSPAVASSPLPGSNPLEDSERQTHSVDVSVYPIHGRIVRSTVVKDISKALTAEIKECLTGLPNWIIDKTLAFTASLYPFAKPTPPPVKRTSAKALIVPDLTNPLTASDSFQEFYASIEDQLREHAHRASFDERAADAPHVNEDERIKQVVERVERAVCALFYDQ